MRTGAIEPVRRTPDAAYLTAPLRTQTVRFDQMKDASQAQDKIDARLGQALAVGLTLKGRFIAAVKSVQLEKYPQSQREAVERRTIEFIDLVLAGDLIARASVDAFNEAAIKLRIDLQLLSHEHPVQSQRDQWLTTVAHHWSGGVEIDELWKALQSDEQIVKVNYLGATIVGPAGGRTITREALRLRSKPGYSDKSDGEWVRMNGPEIRDPAEA